MTCACEPDRPLLTDYYVHGADWTATRHGVDLARLEAKVAQLRRELDIYEIGSPVLHVCGRCNRVFGAVTPPYTGEHRESGAPS